MYLDKREKMIRKDGALKDIKVVSSQKLKERDYWLNKLSGFREKSIFPYDYNKTNPDKAGSDILKFKFSRDLFSRFMWISNRSDIRLYVLLVAGLNVLLSKYSYAGSRDIVIGAPIYRQDIKAEFINTVIALRNEVKGAVTFKNLLFQVSQTVKEAMENQNYPLETLLYQLNITPDENDFPLFDIVVLLENIQDRDYIRHINPNVIFSFLRTESCIEVTLEYNPLLYKKKTLERVLRCLTRLFQAALFNPDLPVSEIDIIPEEEKQDLLSGLNDTNVGYPRDQSIHDLFEAQLERAADHIALVSIEAGSVGIKNRFTSSLSYRELNNKSGRLAHLLRTRGVKPDTIVAIMVERSAEMIVCILSVLKAGGAYLPIEPRYPEDRIKFILADSGAHILLTRKNLDNIEFEKKTVYIDDEDVYRYDTGYLEKTTGPGNMAYVIYTSGTTGKPKGMIIEHRNVVRLMVNDGNLFDFTGSDIWTMFHSYIFDFSVWEMYGALLFGGKLAVIPTTVIIDPVRYLEVLKEENVTVLNQTPSMFYNLAHLELESPRKQLKLRYVIFGGEALNPGKLKEWKKRYPGTRLVNMYGITETTVHVTYKRIEDNEIESGISNIGRPIPTLSNYVLNRDLNLVPTNIAGELCVAGEGLGRGYLNRPLLTKEKFVENPYVTGERLYRSGDLARVMENGDMEYLGRIDNQVKIRGYRIELGEIENQLMRHDKIKDAAVIAKEDGNGDKYLTAYIVANGELNVLDLKDYLLKGLPGYSIPAYFIELDRMPLTINKKTDRKALEKLGGTIEPGMEYVPPRSEIEKRLAHIWSNCLELEKVGIKESYFNIGGDSIKAITLLSRINRQLDTNLKIPDIYMNDTIEKLALQIEQRKMDNHDEAIRKGFEEIEALKTRVISQNKLGNNIEDVYPMSDIERGMIFYSLKSPHSAYYHDQLVYPVKYRQFDAQVFTKAVTLLVEKHSILRTCYNMDDFEESVHIVYKDAFIDLEYYDISDMEAREQEEHIKNFMREDRQNPFIINRPPLWRLRVFMAGMDNIVVLWIFHHVILDGWSNAAFITELNNTYWRLKSDINYRPGELKNSYKRFIVQQMVERKKKQTIAYWKNELTDYKRFEFLDKGKSKGNRGQLKRYRHPLKKELRDKLMETARGYRTNFKHLCVGAYIFMLNMMSYESDITAGLVTNNRPVCEDGEKILGCFLNTIPVKIKIPANIKWREYINIIENKMLELKEFDRLSLFEISRIIGEKTRDRNPIFDVLLNFIDFHVYKQLESMGNEGDAAGQGQSGLSLEYHENPNTLLNFIVSDTMEKFVMVVAFHPGLIDEESVAKSCRYFENVLYKFVYEPERPVDKRDILSEAEKSRLLWEFNNTGAKYPGNMTIHGLFEEQVENTPDNIVLTFKNMQLSYRELNEKADRLAALLRQRGVKPGSISGLITGRSLEMITGIMAVLKAGGAYLPLDPLYPAERIKYMLDDSGVENLLTNEDKDFGIGNVIGLYAPCTAVEGDFPLRETVKPSNPAYVIYTSGTTGKPKGVAVEHGSVVNTLVCRKENYQINSDHVMLQLFSYSFDGFLTSFFTPCLAGAKVVLPCEEDIVDVRKIIGKIVKNNVTHFICIPALYRAILEQISKEEAAGLKVVTLAGDKVSPGLLEMSGHKAGDLEIAIEYGVTEVSVMSTIYRHQEKDDTIKIGKPVWNTEIYILDRQKQIQPPGVPGELCIAGRGVARGYLNRPELTAGKFGEITHKRLYHTGDLARWLPDGNLEFLGRRDHQVKIRGFRIELGEIERKLLEHNEISDAVAAVSPAENDEKHLVAYIVPRAPGSIELLTAPLLIEYLSGALPGYMIPSYFVPLEKIPLSLNGKIHREALPAPRVKKDAGYVPPRGEVEEQVAEIWSEILNIEKDVISVDANFFQLGGHSLSATQLAAKIHKTLKTKIPLGKIFNMPTIRALSGYIEKAAADKYIPIEPVEEREFYPLSSAQERLYVLMRMYPRNTAYNIVEVVELNECRDRLKLEQAFIKLIRRHEILRTSFQMINDESAQKIHAPGEIDFKIEYRQAGEKDEPENIITNFVRPFDLARAPLLRVSLIKLAGKEKHLLLVDIHHIAADGVSMGIIIREFAALYRGESLPGLKLRYRDYSQWQKKLSASGGVKSQEAYWLKQFEKDVPALDLPTDYARPDVQSFEGDTITAAEIGSWETSKLREIAVENGATLNMVLLAIFYILLLKYTDKEDIVVGIPTAGRRHNDLHNLIGMFVNMLPVRHYPSYKKKFIDFLNEVKESSIKAYENQDFQFDVLIERLGLDRDINRNSLFEVVFLFQSYNGQHKVTNVLETGDLVMKPYRFKSDKIRFDLLLNAVETREEIHLKFNYCTALFKTGTIETMGRNLKNIIAEVIGKPGARLSEIEMVSDTEELHLLKNIKQRENVLLVENLEENRCSSKNREVRFNF